MSVEGSRSRVCLLKEGSRSRVCLLKEGSRRRVCLLKVLGVECTC